MPIIFFTNVKDHIILKVYSSTKHADLNERSQNCYRYDIYPMNNEDEFETFNGNQDEECLYLPENLLPSDLITIDKRCEQVSLDSLKFVNLKTGESFKGNCD